MKLNIIYGLVMAPITAISVLTTAPKAEANPMCFYEEGVQVCATGISLSRGGWDTFTVRGHHTDFGRYVEEEFKANCSGGGVSRWESYGNLSKMEAQAMVAEFCSGRGTTGTGY